MSMIFHRIATNMEPGPRTKAYSYIRFSTPEQAQGDSKRRQMELAAKYAEEHGLDLQDASYEDLGVSAFRSANAETGELGTFLEAVKHGQIDKGSWLLIESLDRLSRAKPRKAIRLMEEIVDAGITLVTLSDRRVYDVASLDDDPMAFMYAFMVAIRANEESATKSKRLKQAWSNKRSQAREKKLTALTPSWLRLTEDRKTFTVDEERAAVVRRVFDLARQGKGHLAIAKLLNSEGVPVLDRGVQWHKPVIVKLLQSESVIGTYQPHVIEVDQRNRKIRKPVEKVAGYYPAIVSESVFYDVAALAATKAARGRHAAPTEVKNVLAGIGRCPVCDGTVTRVVKNKRDVYLACAKAKAGAGCQYRAIRYAQVEAAVIAEGWKQWLHDVEIGGDAGLMIDPAYDRLVEAEQQVAGLVEAIVSNPTSHALRNALLKAEAEKDEAERALKEIEDLIAATSAPLVEARLTKLREAVGRKDVPTVNEGLRLLCEKVVVDHWKQELVFHWRHGGTTSVNYALFGGV